MLKQERLKSVRRGPLFHYGYQVPRTVQEALKLDKENGNTRWQDAMVLELTQLQEYNTFWNLGKGAKAPIGYQKITVHFVFDVKHDGRHKA